MVSTYKRRMRERRYKSVEVMKEVDIRERKNSLMY